MFLKVFLVTNSSMNGTDPRVVSGVSNPKTLERSPPQETGNN
jgi:hypothetical protein